MLNGFEHIPDLAAKYNLNVTLGAWVNSNAETTQQEIDTLIHLSRLNYQNIVRTIVVTSLFYEKR